jgi:hypothetical protein
MLFRTIAGFLLAFGAAAEHDSLALMQTKSALLSVNQDEFSDSDFHEEFDDNYDIQLLSSDEEEEFADSDFHEDFDDDSMAQPNKGAIDKSDCPWKCISMNFSWGRKCVWQDCKPCDMCLTHAKGLRCDQDCFKKNPKTHEFRQPWSKKCPKPFCRGCEECGTTTTTTAVKKDACPWSCIEMPYTWGKKCEWEQCSKCEQCKAFAKDKVCKDNCYSGQKGWKEKCQRADCGACSECDDIKKDKESDSEDDTSTPAPTTTCEDSCQEQYDRLAEKGRTDLAKKKTCAKARCEGCDICS